MLADSGTRSQIQATPMTNEPKKSRRPGDLILDRYMPNATPDERESARYDLQRLAKLIIRVTERLAREREDKESQS